jgi:hypothetical protein
MQRVSQLLGQLAPRPVHGNMGEADLMDINGQ